MKLSLIAIGHLPAERVSPLLDRFDKVEVLELDISPRDVLSRHRAETLRAIDASSNDWILIVRERESIDKALADEIVRAVTDDKARGFRIRAVPWYAGAALRLGDQTGELRLFHRRNFLRHANSGEWNELTVQGSVVRLGQPFRSHTFETAAAHRDYLAKSALPHSRLRQVLLFVHNAVVSHAFDRNTLRYLWIEAGFDSGGSS